ncbi:MAG: c-type cytochrome biogenesis protein CcmI [Rhizobiaceae bacterium]|nr:c-type cytochrome biogenesis protein CcmI [Rhizobiaceae bacterium]
MTFFWIVAALMTAAACFAVIWPFLRPSDDAEAGHDVEVYRDQLAEVDRDLTRGAISPAEAEEAKAEIGRRILRAAESESAAASRAEGRLTRVAATLAILFVPVMGLGGYLYLGSPAVPDQALAARLATNPSENSIDELIARAERHLFENPQDGRGWDVLAPIYLRVGRAEDAVIAFRNTIRLNGTNAAREAGLGDALFRVAGSVVTAEAREAFERAMELDRSDPRARFFLALALAQQGDTERAANRWRAMYEELPEDSPWRGTIVQALARVQEDPSQQQARGPSAQDVEAAAELSQEDRAAMIGGMVAQLDERLRDNPHDAAGWQRLIRSYSVLGRADDARAALRRGIDGLGIESAAAAELVAFAAGFGIELPESQ